VRDDTDASDDPDVATDVATLLHLPNSMAAASATPFASLNAACSVIEQLADRGAAATGAASPWKATATAWLLHLQQWEESRGSRSCAGGRLQLIRSGREATRL
jgi:hypothetical protein